MKHRPDLRSTLLDGMLRPGAGGVGCLGLTLKDPVILKPQIGKQGAMLERIEVESG